MRFHSAWGWALQAAEHLIPVGHIYVRGFFSFLMGGHVMSSEKQKVALSSVFAAIFLTAVKIIIGVITGSLGLLSEAAHSALDLGAALVTFFAVRISDKPADESHNYGHGKVESFSALIETALLLATCVWIIYEAFERLLGGKGVVIGGTAAAWGIGIMLLSIVINISRSRALKKAAKKYGSQALEADALHFDSDIWSSLVVIGGLISAGLGDLTGLAFLQYGDPVAALGVSVLVIAVSLKLGKRTIDVLLDTAPSGMINTILHEVNGINGVLEVETVRVRPLGPSYFIDLNVGINRNESHRVVHSIVHEIRSRLQSSIPNSDIVISTFPVDVSSTGDKEAYHIVKKIVDQFPNCSNIHNIHVYEIGSKKHIAIHIEIKECISLNDSHTLSHRISEMIQSAMPDVSDVSVNFEHVKQQHIVAEDITGQSHYMAKTITDMVNTVPEQLNCHDINIYRRDKKLTIFLHCEISGNLTTDEIEKISKDISNKIKSNFENIENVHIHAEPIED